jgi:hypothetical protein
MKKNIISKLIVVLSLVASTTVLSSCEVYGSLDNSTFLGDMVITGPGVNNHELTIEMESTVQLYCHEKFSGMNEVVWKSYNENVATVDQNGVITPVAPGQVRITAYTDTEKVRQGDYVIVTVIAKGMLLINDDIDQSLAD